VGKRRKRAAKRARRLPVDVRNNHYARSVWESVERNAAEVDTWPEWKRLGSGLL